MNYKLISILAAGLLSAAPAFADTVTLDFEGAGEYYFIQDFYNGGTNENGASGANVGVSFEDSALAVSNSASFTYFSDQPFSGDTIMTAADADAALTSTIGFTGLTSFYYSSNENTSVSVYSGNGDLLDTFELAANNGACTGETLYCNWSLASLNIAGIAQSIQFGTAAGAGAGFDNVTINTVPLPAAGWLLMSALGGLGTLLRRKHVG